MTDENQPAPPREIDRAPTEDLDTTGDAALDQRLAEPLLKGTRGIETAQAISAAFLIVSAALLAFSNTLAIGGYNSIERDALVAAEPLHRLVTAPAAWQTTELEPLSALSLAAGWTIFDGSPLFMRLISVVFHGLNCVLVFFIARRVTGIHGSQLVPAAAGLLFAVHPAVTETVNLLTNRGALLGAFWMLLSSVLFLRATAMESLRPFAYGCALVSFALAFAAWPASSVGVALLLGLGLCMRKTTPLVGYARLHAPFWVLAVSLWIAFIAAGGMQRPNFSLAMDFGRLAELLLSTVYPPNLSVAYAESTGMLGFWILVAVAIVGVLLILAVGSVGLAVMWFAVTLAASALLAADRAAAVETALYLPLAGIALLIPLLLARAPAGAIRIGAGGAVAVLVVACAVFTYLRNQQWQSEGELWMDARADCPGCTEPLLRLGEIYIGAGEVALTESQQLLAEGKAGDSANRRDLAGSFFRRARNVLDEAAQKPDPPVDVLVGLGTVQRYQAEPDAARQTLTAALHRDSAARDSAAYAATLQLALLTDQQAQQSGQAADYQRTIELYGRAGQLGRLTPEMLVRLAAAWQELENYERVAAVLSDPELANASPAVPAMLKKAQQRLGAMRAAQQQASGLAQSNPNSFEVLAPAIRALYWRGNYLQAGYLIESLFRGRTPDRELWLMLGVCKAKMDGFQHFLDAWPSPPGAVTPSPWDALARAAAEAGEWGAARVSLARAGDATPVEYRLAEIAAAIGQTQRAVNLLREAAEARPTDPEPWLRLCETVLPFNQKDILAEFLREAETRGAPAERIAGIRSRAGITDSPTTQFQIR